MDPYRDANAPPPYDGPVAPYYPPAHTEKFGPQPPMNPAHQGSPGYVPHGQGYVPQPPGYAPQGYPPQGYAPHAQAYAPLPPTPQVVNITTQPVPQTIIRAITVGQNPMRTDCPQCHENIKTRISRHNSMKTHLFALLLCLCCCWPCIILPYCMSSCKDTTHKCPKCKTFLGTYRA